MVANTLSPRVPKPAQEPRTGQSIYMQECNVAAGTYCGTCGRAKPRAYCGVKLPGLPSLYNGLCGASVW